MGWHQVHVFHSHLDMLVPQDFFNIRETRTTHGEIRSTRVSEIMKAYIVKTSAVSGLAPGVINRARPRATATREYPGALSTQSVIPRLQHLEGQTDNRDDLRLFIF
jgi:hypothetical protein